MKFKEILEQNNDNGMAPANGTPPNGEPPANGTPPNGEPPANAGDVPTTISPPLARRSFRQFMRQNGFTGITSSNKDSKGNLHAHSYKVNKEGNGKTSKVNGHIHKIKKWKVEKNDDHKHTLIK